MDNRELLSRLYPFNRLPRDHLSSIYYLGKIENYRKGKYIYYQGDSSDSFYFLIDGSVKLYLWDSNEKEILVKEEYPGSWLAISEGSLNKCNFYDLRAAKDSTLLRLDRKYLKKLLTLEEVNLSIVQSISNWNFYYKDQSTNNSCMDKLKEFILNNEDQIITITQEELALKLGYTRESINKNLKKLEQMGEIVLRRGSIKKSP